ncbi:hypothetical protein LP7551_00836 [Roseibium album]|nr:hypothetical protein LP7551_00836 [Roseibium album]
MMDILVAWQRWIFDSVRGLILDFGQSDDVWLLLSMASTGVVFGMIHALTPGHGKTILATYLAGSRRGFFQALSVSTVLAATHVNSPEFSRHPRFSFSAAVRTRRVTASRF